jgi:hypothetical protein
MQENKKKKKRRKRINLLPSALYIKIEKNAMLDIMQLVSLANRQPDIHRNLTKFKKGEIILCIVPPFY